MNFFFALLANNLVNLAVYFLPQRSQRRCKAHKVYEPLARRGQLIRLKEFS